MSAKYGALENVNTAFNPLLWSLSVPWNAMLASFLSNLGLVGRISRSSGDYKETSFLFQRISLLLFRFNSVLLHDGFVLDDRPEQ